MGWKKRTCGSGNCSDIIQVRLGDLLNNLSGWHIGGWEPLIDLRP